MSTMRRLPMHGVATPFVATLFLSTAIGVLGALALFGVTAASAQIDSSNVTHYELQPNSRFTWGCFGPCACAIFSSQPLKGTFDLRYVGSDPLFNNYEVSNVRWVLPQASSSQTIEGSGTYRVGGEFAVQQQLSLDLTIGGEPPKHFDSGLVQGGGEFPKIEIEIGRASCRERV